MLRVASQDVRIGEALIPHGSAVYAALGSANRDSTEFPEAQRMDVARAPSGHPTFGHGLRFRIGAPPARLEARIAFETLLRRLRTARIRASGTSRSRPGGARSSRSSAPASAPPGGPEDT